MSKTGEYGECGITAELSSFFVSTGSLVFIEDPAYAIHSHQIEKVGQRIFEFELPFLEVGNHFLFHSVANEVISIHGTIVSSSLDNVLILIKSKEKMTNMFILSYWKFHLKEVSNLK